MSDSIFFLASLQSSAYAGPLGGRAGYDNDMPLIFIGGMPRSGTTLVRVLLDAHPDVRCGEETRIIPRLLSMKQQWTKNPVEMNRLLEAGITDEVVDRAVSSFILEVGTNLQRENITRKLDIASCFHF